MDTEKKKKAEAWISHKHVICEGDNPEVVHPLQNSKTTLHWSIEFFC